MADFGQTIGSEAFAQRARHPDSPNAFTRSRKLPLPLLIAALLSMRNQSQQAMLDGLFASVAGVSGLRRVASDRAFAQARDRLHPSALTWLNDGLVQRAERAGLIQRWCGLRVVAADGSVLMPAVRPCQLRRSAAGRDQRLFAMFLPGAELTLHASVHGPAVSERAMLVEALDHLGPHDVLVLDRGYPAAWLVALLDARGIRFVMRCDNDSGWSATKAFVRSGASEATVRLKVPGAQEVSDWGCPTGAPTVRLVRQLSPSGQIRVLATNLDARGHPAAGFADLYHQRWRIEEAFKRLKRRLHLEAVCGLGQQALLIDVAAKILADNITSLLCSAAAVQGALNERSRKCNRSYAAGLMQRVLPRLALGIGELLAEIQQALSLLQQATQRFVSARSRPRPARHVKPHPSCADKG